MLRSSEVHKATQALTCGGTVEGERSRDTNVRWMGRSSMQERDADHLEGGQSAAGVPLAALAATRVRRVSTRAAEP